MATNKTLLVDIGNTQIKFCWADELDHPARIVRQVEDLFSFVLIHPANKICLASVSNEQTINTIQTFCSDQSIIFQQVTTEKSAFGLKNSYENVSTMGVDRWLAMIAAQKLSNKPFVVIDIGTALTCDFVADGQHLGGWIVPGFHLMKQSLTQNTQRVFADNEVPNVLSLGKRTENCVSQGCLAALQGVYRSAIDYISSIQTDFDVFVTGGDKKMLTELDLGDNLSPANLVMRGLARYAEN